MHAHELTGGYIRQRGLARGKACHPHVIAVKAGQGGVAAGAEDALVKLPGGRIRPRYHGHALLVQLALPAHAPQRGLAVPGQGQRSPCSGFLTRARDSLKDRRAHRSPQQRRSA